MNKSFAALICVLLLAGCRDDGRLADFESDGCSLYPDSNFISKRDWCECCFEHDIAYWKGGTAAERRAADIALKECVLERTGNRARAEAMYAGVRAGGSPYFYNWYRWGYGWDYGRKYRQLTEAEQALAARKLEAYFDAREGQMCE
jgi:hypothetical protein